MLFTEEKLGLYRSSTLPKVTSLLSYQNVSEKTEKWKNIQ